MNGQQFAPSGPPPLLEAQSLTHYHIRPGLGWPSLSLPAPAAPALEDVHLRLHHGKSLGVVGESGSGKSTLARVLMALERPCKGRVLLEGEDLYQLPPAALRRRRRQFQMVFQDPYSSLDPRMPIARSVAQPLHLEPGLGTAQKQERVRQALQAVGLDASAMQRYPHAFSGGQRQRIAIARAIITRPQLLIADEPLSALDVSIQAQIINLLLDLRDQFGMALLFISHDLASVYTLCDQVIVLHQGRVVEQSTPANLLHNPHHLTTQALVRNAKW